jgi:hypothetical protein
MSFIVETKSPTKEFYTGYFLAQIKRIMSVENHPYKWNGIESLLNIINACVTIKKLNVVVFYSNGSWSFEGSDEELMKLPTLIPTFRRLYRHQPNLKGV